MEAAKVEGFSNDVFAVALRLLIYQVVKLRIAERVRKALALLPVILFISFFTILIMWMNHHDIFRLVQRIDGKFMFANAFYFFS